MGETNISTLPADHPQRNTPLAGFWYSLRGGRFREVTPDFGIAKNTYNQLGRVWTEGHEWRAPA